MLCACDEYDLPCASTCSKLSRADLENALYRVHFRDTATWSRQALRMLHGRASTNDNISLAATGCIAQEALEEVVYLRFVRLYIAVDEMLSNAPLPGYRPMGWPKASVFMLSKQSAMLYPLATTGPIQQSRREIQGDG